MSRILVVEDSGSMRQLIRFALESAGFEVTEATDGKEAIDLAQSETFDLVISDVKMPNKDGLELTAALRTLPEYKFTPILLLTAVAEESQKEKGRQVGATGWILKPFDSQTLVNAINKVLK